MAQILIRNLDDKTKHLLTMHAQEQGLSMEGYARQVIDQAVRARQPEKGFGSQLMALFADCQLDEPLELPERQPIGEPRVAFDDHP